MKKIKENQNGFSLLLILVIVIALTIVGGISWRVYEKSNNDSSEQNKSETTKNNPVNDQTEVVATKIEPKICGSDELIDELTDGKSEVKLPKISAPNEWKISDTLNNAYYLKSSDFSSENNLRGIKTGSHISVSVKKYCTFDKDINNDLKSFVGTQSQGTPTNTEYTTIKNYPGVSFNHDCCENKNSHLVKAFLKDDLIYSFDQQYKIGAPNPYPKSIDEIISSISF